MPNWSSVRDSDDVQQIDQLSQEKPCLIYKHSTRCSISSLAMNRLENRWDVSPDEVYTFFLDLITYRATSDLIASHYSVRHESPQVLLIYKGQCIYHDSHMSISVGTIKQMIREIPAAS